MPEKLSLEQIFLSSTNDDFSRDFRLAAKNLIDQVYSDYFRAVEMGEFGPTRDTPLQVSKNKVRECQIYVGIIGALYGSSPPEEPDKSYTEVEFDTALENRLEMLVYILEANTHMQSLAEPYTYMQKNRKALEKQEKFRAKIENSGITIDYVSSRDEFITKLNRHLNKRFMLQAGVYEGIRRTEGVIAVKPDYEPPLHSTYATVISQFERATKYVTDANLIRGYLDILKYPQREVLINFPVKMDDGSISVFTGYRVHHNTTLGPALGGIRYHPSITLDDIRSQAMSTTWQCALLSLPYGGAAGGVVVDINHLSVNENERLTRSYTAAMINEFSPERDIPTTDFGTTSQNMAWIMDTYSKFKGHAVPSAVTDKPLKMGGSQGRPGAAGQSVVIAMLETLKIDQHYSRPDDLKIAINGFGSVGMSAAQQVNALGGKVVAINDFTAGIFDPHGLPIDDVVSYVQQGGLLIKYPNPIAQLISQDELLTLPCDVLILTASGTQLTDQNAPKISARYVVEGVYTPITPEADEILAARGIEVIPDILANTGSIIASYFEWVQGLQSFFWDAEEVSRQLQRIVVRTYDEVRAVSESRQVSLRVAAHILAFDRILSVSQITGIYP